MDIILKSVFDIQAGQKYDIVALLDKCISSYFAKRTYSSMVEEVNIETSKIPSGILLPLVAILSILLVIAIIIIIVLASKYKKASSEK